MRTNVRQIGSSRRGAVAALATVAVALAGSIAYVVSHDRPTSHAGLKFGPSAAVAAEIPQPALAPAPVVTSNVIFPPRAEIELNDATPPAHEKPVHEKPAETKPTNNPWPEIALGAARPETPNVALERVLLVTDGLDDDGKLSLLMNKSTILSTKAACKRVSVGSPDVADVNPVGPNSLLVTAKKPGSTQLIVWDDGERSQVIDLAVTTDLAALQDQLKQQFPGSKIDASMANAQLVLRGQVPSILVAEQAVQLAQPYAPKVLNFLEIAGGQQVMLQVRFAEVSRSATNQLGFNFGSTDGTSFFGSNIGQVSPLGTKELGTGGGVALAVQTPNPSVTLFGTGAIGNSAFAYYIAALRQNNLLRILAEPNLTAISGQEASFLAGGSFPVPVTQGGGTGAGGTAITVEYRSFGVKLRFIPVVLGDGKIRLKVAPEVSDLDFTTAVRFNGYVIPGLTERKLETVIEMREGQTFALAGLLNNNVSATKDVTPVLGDIPYLGALFRSVRYQRKETELVVIVTPRLVEAMNPAQVPMLPGEKWRHPSEGDLFWSRDIGGPAGDPRRAATNAGTPAAKAGEPPRFKGQFGYVPPEGDGE
jgi:pilus assembly protein CpaC